MTVRAGRRTVPGMRSRITPAWLAAAAGLAVFQVIGSFGAADNQADRRGIDAVAVVLVLIGPAAVALVARWPLPSAAAALGAADLFIGLGYPYGPVFVSSIVCLFAAVQVAPRRGVWGVGCGVGRVRRLRRRPRAG